MPSDERIVQALKSLSGQTQAFRSSLATTIDQIRNFQTAHGSAADGKIDRLALELGPFAAGRIDLERYSSLHTDTLKLDRPTLETIDKALQTLTDLASRGDDLFLLDVPGGGDLHDTVAAALADVGRAFGAARVFEVSKLGRFPDTEHARSLGSFPFDKWSSGERRLAPPLIVLVDGSDLRASGLAEFMDGTQKIVLAIRGDSTPVPLVRLITPGTFVLQTTAAEEIGSLAQWDGAGVAAIVPESAARFVHDPGLGVLPTERIRIVSLPEDRRRRPVGGVSVRQQSEELLQLRSLAGQADAATGQEIEPAAAGVPTSSDPADKLAAWLLSQADLKDLG